MPPRTNLKKKLIPDTFYPIVLIGGTYVSQIKKNASHHK